MITMCYMLALFSLALYSSIAQYFVGWLTALCRQQALGRQCTVNAIRHSFCISSFLNLLETNHLKSKVKIFLKLLELFSQIKQLYYINTSKERLN